MSFHRGWRITSEGGEHIATAMCLLLLLLLCFFMSVRIKILNVVVFACSRKEQVVMSILIVLIDHRTSLTDV
jgi:hypothetical protein